MGQPFFTLYRSFTTSAVLLASLLLAGCLGPYTYQREKLPENDEPTLGNEYATMGDGYILPTVTYESDTPPRAIVLALHGFNDYRNAFVDLASFFVKHDVVLIAYDQRGFGETEGIGFWHGTEALSGDLLTMIHLTRERYPETPLYILGESMGGAVIMVSLESFPKHGEVAGVILVAPAVWAYHTMPWYQRGPMWFFAHVMPWFYLSSGNLDIMPSDNIEMLRALGRDPLVIKGARSDVVYGLTLLMSDALKASERVDLPTLILYGEKDEIVPKKPTCEMLQRLPGHDPVQWRFMLYENGYHMLTRDLQANQVYDDILQWMVSKEVAGEKNGVAEEELKIVCE